MWDLEIIVGDSLLENTWTLPSDFHALFPELASLIDKVKVLAYDLDKLFRKFLASENISGKAIYLHFVNGF